MTWRLSRAGGYELVIDLLRAKPARELAPALSLRVVHADGRASSKILITSAQEAHALALALHAYEDQLATRER